MCAFLERELQQVEHTITEASALLPAPEPATPGRQAPGPLRPLANRWIGLPALTTLIADDEPASLCQCAAPMAADGTSSRR
ncbi:hypothetical protein [Streptomyces sp. NPDC002209]|uniref:hypothetical protein n=1 Tax=Streptomyces sp. NPDC002209 TaxID=3364638 RepID=UPI0036B3FCFF